MSVLTYLHSLTLQGMEPQDFVNTMEARLAVSKVISSTTEPKNADVRKVRIVILFAANCVNYFDNVSNKYVILYFLITLS